MTCRSALFLIGAILAPTSYPVDKIPIPKGRRLREIVADKYPGGNVYIGGTTGWKKRARGSGIVLDREFNYCTPENDFKHSVINPRPGVWRWELADNWIKHCAKVKQVIRIHGPISPQASKWALADERTGPELKQSLIEFMTKLCKRYDKYPQVKWMDVVNETVIPRRGTWNMPKPGTDKWENPWPKIGFDNAPPLNPPSYIRLAFEVATKYAPNTKLLINQHGNMEDKNWDKIKAIVKYLRGRGLRVDGIGWQAHIDVGFESNGDNMKKLDALIAWCHENKLSFHVTENNVWLKKKIDYQAQAKTFAAILSALLKHRHSGEVTWNVWNLSDGDAFIKKKHLKGSILYPDFQPKPAYYALQKVLENPPQQVGRN